MIKYPSRKIDNWKNYFNFNFNSFSLQTGGKFWHPFLGKWKLCFQRIAQSFIVSIVALPGRLAACLNECRAIFYDVNSARTEDHCTWNVTDATNLVPKLTDLFHTNQLSMGENVDKTGWWQQRFELCSSLSVHFFSQYKCVASPNQVEQSVYQRSFLRKRPAIRSRTFPFCGQSSSLPFQSHHCNNPKYFVCVCGYPIKDHCY